MAETTKVRGASKPAQDVTEPKLHQPSTKEYAAEAATRTTADVAAELPLKLVDDPKTDKPETVADPAKPSKTRRKIDRAVLALDKLRLPVMKALTVMEPALDLDWAAIKQEGGSTAKAADLLIRDAKRLHERLRLLVIMTADVANYEASF